VVTALTVTLRSIPDPVRVQDVPCAAGALQSDPWSPSPGDEEPQRRIEPGRGWGGDCSATDPFDDHHDGASPLTHPETYDGPRLTAAIVIPALDEAESIEDSVVELHAHIDQLATDGHSVDIRQVIVVDNGSTDDTAIRAETGGAVVVSEPRRGYGRACATGVLAAGDVDLIIQMDGDGSDNPADLAALLAPIVAGTADLVTGSRTLGTAERGALLPQQVVGNWVATRALRLRYGVRATDIGPFRVIRRDQLLTLGMSEMTYGWSTEMMARAARAGLRLAEVPVSYRVRAGGESKVSGNLRASLRASERIMGTVLRAARDRPDRETNPFPVHDADR